MDGDLAIAWCLEPNDGGPVVGQGRCIGITPRTDNAERALFGLRRRAHVRKLVLCQETAIGVACGEQLVRHRSMPVGATKYPQK